MIHNNWLSITSYDLQLLAQHNFRIMVCYSEPVIVDHVVPVVVNIASYAEPVVVKQDLLS
jgi:hypothetical protein